MLISFNGLLIFLENIFFILVAGLLPLGRLLFYPQIFFVADVKIRTMSDT